MVLIRAISTIGLLFLNLHQDSNPCANTELSPFKVLRVMRRSISLSILHQDTKRKIHASQSFISFMEKVETISFIGDQSAYLFQKRAEMLAPGSAI